jgi:multidrug efflux pump subunit AcrA (membrane-fusion protein)
MGSERLIVVALSFWLAGCNNQQPAVQGPPPAEVTVSKPEQKEVVNWNEFTGRTAAVKLVTVTARVSGYIVDIPFKEGDLVHKGDLLFQIDPRPGALKAKAAPIRNTKSSMRLPLRRCNQPRIARPAAEAANQRCVILTNFARSTMSARAPAGSVNRKNGSELNVDIMDKSRVD